MPPLEGLTPFQHFSAQHLIVIFLTIVLPFVLADTLRLALLVAFPMISLWLPQTMSVR